MYQSEPDRLVSSLAYANKRPDPVHPNGGAKLLSSRELFGSTNEVFIEHNGCRYSLRMTRQNKLILTK